MIYPKIKKKQREIATSDAKKIEGGDGGNAWAWLSDEDSENVCGRRRRLLQRSGEDDSHKPSL